MRALLVAPAALAFALVGCGGQDFTHGRPKISALHGPNQTGAFKLEFAIDFFDTDQDLGNGGSLHLLVDNQEAQTMLSDLFDAQSPPIAHDAVQGTFFVDVNLSPTIKAGDDVSIGFFLLDAKGEKSNVPTVVLQATMTGG